MGSPSEENLLDHASFGELQDQPSASISQAIRQQCTEDLVAKRSLTRTQRALLCLIPVVLVISSLAMLQGGKGVHNVSQTALLGAGGWSLVLLCVLSFGVSAGSASQRILRVLAALAIPLAYLVYLALGSDHWVPLAEVANHSHSTAHCGTMSLSLGAVTTVAVMFVWKRSDPFNPGLSGALIGLVGGLAGALSVHMVCPSQEGWHLWLGHGLSVMLIAGLSVALGRKLLAP